MIKAGLSEILWLTSHESNLFSQQRYCLSALGCRRHHNASATHLRLPKIRRERGSLGAEVENTTIFDARQTDDLGLEKSGFELVKSSSSVSDFMDNEEVMTVYYEECKEIARKLTGASVTFTYDH